MRYSEAGWQRSEAESYTTEPFNAYLVWHHGIVDVKLIHYHSSVGSGSSGQKRV